MPLRGIFVPLIQRSMYYATSSEGESGEGVIVGSAAQVRLATGFDRRVVMTSPDGEEWIPEQRGSLQGVILTVPTALRDPGVYDVRVDDQVVSRIAVNGYAAESDLGTIDPSEAARHFESPGGYDVTILGSATGGISAAAGGSQRAGIEIWNVFLGLALLFLVVEMVVAKR
jgi:hypothetical protein